MEPEDSAAHAQPKGEACIVPARPLWFDHCNRRHVVPYMHTLRVRAKGRWLGRTVVDVFAAEFQHHTRAYYSAAADSGRLYVEFDPTGGNHRSHKKRPRARNDGTVVGLQNGEPNHDETDNNCGLAWVRRSLDHKIERCDVIVHVIHKHELSVFSTAIPVVEAVVLDPGRPFHGVVVVNKPCSLPTHSSGRYHFNACLSMLEAWLVAPPAAAPTDSSSSSQAGMLAATAYRPVAYSSLACFGPGVSVLDQAALRAYATAAAAKHADGRVELRACHRLDKATSGVLICALTREAASFVGDLLAAKTKSVEACLDAWLASGDAGRGAADGRCAATAGLAHMVSRFGILKTYVARVDGEFPMRGSRGDDGCALPLHGLCPMEDGCEDADWAIVEPLAVDERWQKRSGGDERSGDGDEDESGESAHVCGLAAATKEVQAPKVQTAVTLCKRLQYVEASRESIVVCMPLTGRTHQIRRHLAHVGFPIANDTKYNPRLTKGLCAAAEVPVYFDFAELPPEVQRQTVRDPLCSECKQELPVTKSGDMESVIFLHAWRYRVQWGDEAAHVAAPAASKTFETALPEWACCGGA